MTGIEKDPNFSATNPSLIRNFSVIAHVDHGKTTLTDCFLRQTGLMRSDQAVRVLDSNPIEVERGITIKLAPVRMSYQTSILGQTKTYILNLIDTPGHVDFGYEVSRSLAACEGVVLVVDATQGIQAQTLSNFAKARDLGLTIIPVVNKIDLPSADVETVVLELMELCQVEENSILLVSAKTGQNTQSILDEVVRLVPPPVGKIDQSLRALLITSYFDPHKGAIGLLRVVDGQLSARSKLQFLSSQQTFFPLEVGVYTPFMSARDLLLAGEVGYVATGLKDVRQVRVGDTLTLASTNSAQTQPIPGFREPTPMVFTELYPVDSGDFTDLQDAMSKLVLRDAAISHTGVHSAALGSGFRVGFLGLLHAEVVLERLQQEFDLAIIATPPSVTYLVKMEDGAELKIEDPSQFPDPSLMVSVSEPLANTLIITPPQYVGECTQMIQEHRGELTNTQSVGHALQLTATIPLAELIQQFHDQLKSRTSGYASFDYEMAGYQVEDIQKVTILLNHEPVDALSFLCPESQVEARGRSMVDKLHKSLKRQMFEVAIQAAVGGRIIARETIRPFRKDVTAKLYGGDRTRRMKLLAKQAKGKKKMKMIGKVEIDQQTFLAILKR